MPVPGERMTEDRMSRHLSIIVSPRIVQCAPVPGMRSHAPVRTCLHDLLALGIASVYCIRSSVRALMQQLMQQ